MAVFSDYLDLKVAVSEHVGNRDISDVYPRLLEMAENVFNKKLRTRRQMTTATLAFTAGSAVLPTDCLEIISLFGPVGEPYRATSIADVKAPSSAYSQYAVDGLNVLIYGLDGTREVRYYAAIPTLNSGPVTASNWLLQDHPMIYLYGVGYEAAKFLRDTDLAGLTAQLLGDAMADVKADDLRERWANGVVRMQGITP